MCRCDGKSDPILWISVAAIVASIGGLYAAPERVGSVPLCLILTASALFGVSMLTRLALRILHSVVWDYPHRTRPVAEYSRPRWLAWSALATFGLAMASAILGFGYYG